MTCPSLWSPPAGSWAGRRTTRRCCADYEKVNDLLAACESEIRRSFLTEVGQALDQKFGPLVHLIDAWNIDKARDVAWVNAEALWELRRLGALARRYQGALARTVGMASRCLLTEVVRS